MSGVGGTQEYQEIEELRVSGVRRNSRVSGVGGTRECQSVRS